MPENPLTELHVHVPYINLMERVKCMHRHLSHMMKAYYDTPHKKKGHTSLGYLDHTVFNSLHSILLDQVIVSGSCMVPL